MMNQCVANTTHVLIGKQYPLKNTDLTSNNRAFIRVSVPFRAELRLFSGHL